MAAHADGRTPEAATAPLSLAVILLLALGHCAAFVDRNLPATAAPLLKADLGLSDGQIGLLQGPAFAVLYAVGMLATAPLARSRHRFRLLAACVAGWALGMVAFAVAPSFEALVASRALVGLAQAAFVPLALGLIVERTPAMRRARSIAAFTAGSVLGRSLALLGGGLALALLLYWLPIPAMEHWRLLFLVMAAPNLLLILLLWRCREREPLAPEPAASLRAILVWLRARPAAAALYLCGAGGSVLVVQSVGAWAPSILNREQHLPPAQAALAFGAALALASPLGHFIAGMLVDRSGVRVAPTRVVAAGLLLAIPLLLAVPYAGSAATACALLALASFAGGAAAVASLAGLPPALPAPLRGPAVRLFLVFITVAGVGLGPFAAGLVSDSFGEGGRGLSQALCLVCLAAAIPALLAALRAGSGWHRAVAEVASA